MTNINIILRFDSCCQQSLIIVKLTLMVLKSKYSGELVNITDADSLAACVKTSIVMILTTDDK